MISMNRRKKKKKYQFTKLYKKQSPTKKSSISRGSSVSSNNSFNLYGNAQSVRSKTYAVTQYTFAEIKCDDINIHLSLPWTSNNNHKSLIFTVGTLYLFNFRDNQPLPVIVWGDQQTVTDSFPFILKQKNNYKQNIIPTNNEYHPGFFHDRIYNKVQFKDNYSPQSTFQPQIDSELNAISFYKSTSNQNVLTETTQISIGYLSLFANFKSTGISRFISEFSTFLSFGKINKINIKRKQHKHKKTTMSSPISTSFDAERQSVISDESFLSGSYASTSRPPSTASSNNYMIYNQSIQKNKNDDIPNKIKHEIPLKKLRINIASISLAVRCSDIEDWKLESLYLNNVNTLLLELAGVDIQIHSRSTPVALNISCTKTQDYSILLSGACVRFL